MKKIKSETSRSNYGQSQSSFSINYFTMHDDASEIKQKQCMVFKHAFKNLDITAET